MASCWEGDMDNSGKHYYVLVDGKIQKADILEASQQLEGKNGLTNKIVHTELQIDGEKIDVSTVFLGIDHGWGRRELPVLFETMVFGGKLDEWQWRYCTLEEAQVGHQI